MNTLITFAIGFGSALLYARGKADPVRSLRIDIKRFFRWVKAKLTK